MQHKKDPYSGAAQKVVGLYALLLFTGRKHSLPQLAEMFQCSKQTVLRMIEQIELTHRVQIDTWMEGGRKWYKARTPRQRPNVALTVGDIQQLLLCRDIVWRLFPEALREGIARTIEQTAVLLPDYDDRAEALESFARAQPKGIVDYSNSRQIMDTLLRAMRERRVCRITYRSPEWDGPRELSVAPHKFILFREGFYAKCRREEDLENATPRDRTLAVHRMGEVIPTDRRFAPITDDDDADDTFGLAREKPFRVVVDFISKAAMYIRERIWSKDQVITDHKDGGITLEFTATSTPEVLAWVLSFGGEATLRDPMEMKKEILLRINKINNNHIS